MPNPTASIQTIPAADYPLQLTDRVSLLGNPLFSVYLVRGDGENALIETGISATVSQILDQIESLDVDRESITRLLVTHAHADHTAGMSGLRKALPNLKVFSGAKTADLLGRPKIVEAFGQDDLNQSDRLARLGFAEPGAGPKGPLNLGVDGIIEPGQKLDLGGLALEALDAPGHSPGGLAFWEPAKRMIFCADYLGFFLPPDKWVANFYADLDSYLDTFEKLFALEPKWLCPGHSGAYGGQDVITFISGSLAEIAWAYDSIRAQAPFDEPPKGLVEEIHERYYQGISELFTPESMLYCAQLLIRRVLDSSRNPKMISLK